MARSRIATGLEKLMSDLPRLMLQRNLAESAQMKKLSIQATEGYLKEAANYTTEAQFDAAAASIMDELGEYGDDPTIAMAGNNAFRALGRLKENFIQKQEGVVALNSGFKKAKELNELDTTSGLNDIYKAAATTLEAKKQYFNSTEYSGYKKNLEDLAEMIKVKSLTNYLDDLAVGETDEQGNIIVKPGIQSANSKLEMVNQLHKVGMINNKDAMKQLIEISEDINAGTAGVIMNSGAKDMRILDRQLKDFNYDGLPDKYKNKLLMSFDALQFTEKELTPDNINYVRSNLEETLNNVIGKEGFFRDQFLQDLPGSGSLLEKLEAKIIKDRSKEPGKPIRDIIEDVIDVYGLDIGKEDADTIAQKSHFSKMMELYMKTGDVLHDIGIASQSKNIDSSIASYTNALSNYGQQLSADQTEEEPKRVKMSTLPSDFIPSKFQDQIDTDDNITDLVKLIEASKAEQEKVAAEQQRAQEFADIPFIPFAPDPSRRDSVRIEGQEIFSPGAKNVTDLVRAISNQSPEGIRRRQEEFANIPFVPNPLRTEPPRTPIMDAMPAGSDVSDIVRSIKGITIPPQEPDQDDISYIDSISPSELKNISKYLDKKVMNIYKKEAIRSLTKDVKELEILERSQSDATAERVSRELPRLRKLLAQFKKAKFKGVSSMSINKDMLEYMYLMSSTRYDGVDDFIASLSDKIGIE